MAITKNITQQPFDVDAQRFILAAGLTRFVDKRAINYLIQNFKTNNLWTKCAAIYPMVGGNVWSCKLNLINPIDSVLAFRLNFTANPTISYNGIDWNGTTQFANTNLAPSSSSVIAQNSSHISYYSRDNINESSIDMGATDIGGYTYIDIRISDTTRGLNNNLSTDVASNVANTDSRGFFMNTRTNATQLSLVKNGVTTTFTQVSFGRPSGTIYIGARNNSGTAANFGSKQCAFASIGSGLTSTDAFNMYNIVQQFQIILNRAV